MWLSTWTPTIEGFTEQQKIRNLGWDPILSAHTWRRSDVTSQWSQRFIIRTLSLKSTFAKQSCEWQGYIVASRYRPAPCTNAVWLWALSYLLFGIQRQPFNLSLTIFKESPLNNNMSEFCVSYHILNVWVCQSKDEHVCTFSPCPKCSVLTSLSVFQLVFPPPLPLFISVRDCPSMAWPSLSYLCETKRIPVTAGLTPAAVKCTWRITRIISLINCLVYFNQQSKTKILQISATYFYKVQ